MAAVPGTSASSDPVESLAFDRATQRLVVTSHFGEIRAYRIELQGQCIIGFGEYSLIGPVQIIRLPSVRNGHGTMPR